MNTYKNYSPTNSIVQLTCDEKSMVFGGGVITNLIKIKAFELLWHLMNINVGKCRECIDECLERQPSPPAHNQAITNRHGELIMNSPINEIYACLRDDCDISCGTEDFLKKWLG